MKVNITYMLLTLVVGIFSGVVLSGYTIGADAVDTAQEKTDLALKQVAERDSLVLILEEQVLFYEEAHENLSIKFDSLATGATIQVAELDSLVHSSFDSLPDSAKLAYKEKVLARLRSK